MNYQNIEICPYREKKSSSDFDSIPQLQQAESAVGSLLQAYTPKAGTIENINKQLLYCKMRFMFDSGMTVLLYGSAIVLFIRFHSMFMVSIALFLITMIISSITGKRFRKTITMLMNRKTAVTVIEHFNAEEEFRIDYEKKTGLMLTAGNEAVTLPMIPVVYCETEIPCMKEDKKGLWTLYLPGKDEGWFSITVPAPEKEPADYSDTDRNELLKQGIAIYK